MSIEDSAMHVKYLFDLMHECQNDNSYNNEIRKKCKELIISLIYPAWTDEAGNINPTKEILAKFVSNGMSIGINKTFDQNKSIYKIIYTITSVYFDESIDVQIVDYIS